MRKRRSQNSGSWVGFDHPPIARGDACHDGLLGDVVCLTQSILYGEFVETTLPATNLLAPLQFKPLNW